MDTHTVTGSRTLEDFVGNTPLVRLKRVAGATTNTLLAKLEGNNPAGSVKDRPAFSMIRRAQERGTIKPGDTLIEPTSGNTGIALAMCAAMMGYRMILVMPEHLSVERRQSMAAFGAESSSRRNRAGWRWRATSRRRCATRAGA
jgi:cysteine synthase B